MEALLQLKGIDKAFPGVKALSGAALNVYPGRVMALVGENGAGKSTLMEILFGMDVIRETGGYGGDVHHQW